MGIWAWWRGRGGQKGQSQTQAPVVNEPLQAKRLDGRTSEGDQRPFETDPEVQCEVPGETRFVSSPEAAIERAGLEGMQETPLEDPVLRGEFTRADFDVALRDLTQQFESEGKPAPTEDDAKWYLLTEAALEHGRSGAMGLCRNVYYKQSRFLAARGRYKDALEVLCRVCAMDLNGSSNGPKPFDQSEVMLAPRVVEELRDMAEELGAHRDALRALYIKVAGQIRMPLDPERTWPILEAALSGEIDLNDQPKCFREIRRRLAV